MALGILLCHLGKPPEAGGGEPAHAPACVLPPTEGTKGAHTHLTRVCPEDDDALCAGTHRTRKMLPVLSQPDPGALRTKPPGFSDGFGLLLWPDTTLKNHGDTAAL